jgi:hypothetical protein
VTFAAEAVGGILLVLGVQTRWVVLALSPHCSVRSSGCTPAMAGFSPRQMAGGNIPPS